MTYTAASSDRLMLSIMHNLCACCAGFDTISPAPNKQGTTVDLLYPLLQPSVSSVYCFCSVDAGGSDSCVAALFVPSDTSELHAIPLLLCEIVTGYDCAWRQTLLGLFLLFNTTISTTTRRLLYFNGPVNNCTCTSINVVVAY